MLYRLPAKRLWEQSIPAEESPRNVMFKTLAATEQAETAAISEVGFHGFGPSDRRAGGSTQLLQARNGTWALTNPFAHFIFPGSPAPTMLGQVSTRNKKNIPKRAGLFSWANTWKGLDHALFHRSNGPTRITTLSP